MRPKMKKVSLQNSNFSSQVTNFMFNDMQDDCSIHCDLILKCGPKLFQYYCHRLMFAATSGFIKELLASATPGTTPVIVLPDIKPNTIKFIIDFVYNGEVRVPLHEYADFVDGCTLLQLKGLTEEADSEDENDEEMPQADLMEIPPIPMTKNNNMELSGREEGETDDDDDEVEDEAEVQKIPSKPRGRIAGRKLSTNTKYFEASPETISIAKKQLKHILTSVYTRIDKQTDQNLDVVISKTKLVIEENKIPKAEHECGFCGTSIALYYPKKNKSISFNHSNFVRHLKKHHNINYTSLRRGKKRTNSI